MPVEAVNNINHNYNKWSIKEFIVAYTDMTMTIKYGLCAIVDGKTKYKTMNTVVLSPNDFFKCATAIVDGDKNLKDNIKDTLYGYLIDNGLIDNNDII